MDNRRVGKKEVGKKRVGKVELEEEVDVGEERGRGKKWM